MQTRTTGKISIKQFIDTSALNPAQRRIIFLTFLFLVADGLDVTIVSHIFPALIADWGTSMEQVTLTVTVGTAAMALGAIASGPIADRVGRRPVLVSGFIFFNVATAGLALTGSIEAFIALRIIACIGIGAVTPVGLTMVADWVPSARRAQFVALTLSGVSLGAVLGSYLAASILPSFGWRALALTAGLLPMLIIPFYMRSVPEPPSSLIKRGNSVEKLEQSLAVIAADYSNVDRTISVPEAKTGKNGFVLIFSRALALSTMLIWVLFFITQGITMVAMQYLPILLQQADPGPDLDTVQSGLIVAMWGWGALIGQLLVSFILKGVGPFLTGTIASVWTIGGALLIALGNFGFTGLMVALLLTGLAIAALPSIASVVATNVYPAASRATGVGTGNFLGRIGSLASGLAGGILIGLGMTIHTFFAALTIPTLIGLAVLVGIRSETRRGNRTADEESIHR